MNKKLLSLYSLKFNPFSPEVPTCALWSSPSIESFCWRIEQQIGEGGFALAIGDPGTGKSGALRLQFGHFETVKPGEILDFSLGKTFLFFCWPRSFVRCSDVQKWSHYMFRAVR